MSTLAKCPTCGGKCLPPTLAAEYAAGATLLELEARHGIAWSSIRYHLVKQGVAMRPTGCRTGTTMRPGAGQRRIETSAYPELLAAFDAGDTLESIAAAHGITRERVRQITVLHGRPARRGHRPR